MKIVRILGNGDRAPIYNMVPRVSGDKLLICNMPPFAVENVYASVMVDFKMMNALTEGSLKLDAYDWVLGNRPKIWMHDHRPSFYMNYAKNVKEFYTIVPKYAGNATNFNCGHMATHYAANRLKADKVQMFGFDSLFDFNMRSVSDLYLPSDRTDGNNLRLMDIWRPIFTHIFEEFPNTQFELYHNHDKIKIKLPKNAKSIAVNG